MSKRLEFEEIGKFLNGRSIRYIKVDAENYSEYWHFHPEIEITFVEKGNGIRVVGNNISSFQDNDLVLLGKNLPHCYRITAPENLAIHQSHAIQFPLEIFKRLPDLEVFFAFIKSAEAGYRFINPSDEIKQKVIQFPQLPKHEQFISLLSIINELYNHKNREIISDKKPKELKQLSQKSNRINLALSLIYKTDGNITNLEECADQMNMSKTYFCRWFKKSTGHTFTEYRNKVMIEKFCQALILSDESISSLAFKIGFENIYSFNRIFKKVKGTTPSTYRQNYLSALKMS